ncbi:MAG: hypothetical protein KDB27_30500, partial [Planctomycetales bacterium]|nr:hypothetical protein [Planctomycetales bacterium]
MKFSLPARINFRSWNATTRIAFALAMWSSTVLLGLRMFGVIDDNIELVLESRVDRCEAIAYACAKLANNGDKYGVESMLQYHVERSPEIVAAKCTVDGKTLFQSAHHNDSQWKNDSEDASLTCIRIPIWKKDAVTKIPSGFVDFTFTPPISSGLPGFLERRSILIAILATGFNLLGFMFITRRCFRALDPSKVVPDRVRSALDTLAEMVI